MDYHCNSMSCVLLCFAVLNTLHWHRFKIPCAASLHALRFAENYKRITGEVDCQIIAVFMLILVFLLKSQWDFQGPP